jgi:hypothetical protein
MDQFYPTEAWSNVPAFQNIDDEGEFWDTHTLLPCGDDVCAEPVEYSDDEMKELAALRDVPRVPGPPMSLGSIHFVVVSHLGGGYTSYPLGMEGVVVGQGDTFDEALESAKSATLFHIESFGLEHLLSTDAPSDQRANR